MCVCRRAWSFSRPEETPTLPRSKLDALKERDYQVDVLNKCEERPPTGPHPAAAMLYLIALHVPRGIISQALGAMQDARLNNRDPEGVAA